MKFATLALVGVVAAGNFRRSTTHAKRHTELEELVEELRGDADAKATDATDATPAKRGGRRGRRGGRRGGRSSSRGSRGDRSSSRGSRGDRSSSRGRGDRSSSRGDRRRRGGRSAGDRRRGGRSAGDRRRSRSGDKTDRRTHRRSRSLEDDLIEDIHVHYPKRVVDGFKALCKDICKTAHEAERDLHKKWPTMERDVKEMGAWAMKRYGKDLMMWGKSPSVRAVENYKRAMFKTSRELHQVMSDGYTLFREFASGGVKYGYGMNKDGSYDEWMSNKSLKHVFEELYNLAKDVRKLIESPMARNLRRLERLTLNDPAFHRIFKHLQDDIGAHTW